eukprot:GFUD01032611.1.p1 GENE.GFUD01032611.1~~GFUD01032611.1.p1  ORF type:complete len:193 (-),score=40.13 GFUD01032611.1:49-627(-)
MSGYCMNCVPLRPGVWAIALLQIMYGSVRIYMATLAEDEEKGFYYYLDFTGHCFSLAAAVILMLGLLFEKNNLLLPWIGLTILTPANFVGNLILNLIFFNFPGAMWLITKEGIPALLITYLITVVYTLYLQMLGKTSVDVESPAQESDTMYGTANMVFVTDASSSIVGTTPTRDFPPSYESLVVAHKEHVST